MVNGIVHLGLGAFARAHLLPATQAAMDATGDRRWGVVGVSLRSAAVRDALAPLGFAYDLVLRDAGGERVVPIRCLTGVLVGADGPRAVHEHIADPMTRIVSLTVTEKGYVDTAHGSTLDTLARGLALRRERGAGGVTVMSLDNLPSNGRVLRERLLGVLSSDLAAWVEAHCAFPCSMVDRIVPRPDDAARVVAEPYFDWVVEDRFVAERPAWEHAGVRFVADVAPFEALKLRMVNGAHSALAWLGALAGWATVDEALAQPALRGWLDALLRDEVAPTLPALTGLDLAAYRAGLLARFANPALKHRTLQIAMDSSQKLPQRLLGTIADRLAAGAPFPRLALAVAAWVRFVEGRDERGAALPLDDPMAEALRAAAAPALDVDAFLRAPALATVFGALAHDARFRAAVTAAHATLRERGVPATLSSS